MSAEEKQVWCVRLLASYKLVIGTRQQAYAWANRKHGCLVTSILPATAQQVEDAATYGGELLDIGAPDVAS